MTGITPNKVGRAFTQGKEEINVRTDKIYKLVLANGSPGDNENPRKYHGEIGIRHVCTRYEKFVYTMIVSSKCVKILKNELTLNL